MRSLGLPPPPMPYSSENEPESLIMDETRIMSSLGWIYVLLVAIVFHESMCLATQCGLNCASFYDLGGFRGCLRAAMKAPGALVFPGSPTYTNATQVCNARFAPLPAAIVYAHSTSDVTEAVKCGLAWDVRVSAASGRHSNQATSLPDSYLIVDLTNLTKVSFMPQDNGVLIGVEGGVWIHHTCH